MGKGVGRAWGLKVKSLVLEWICCSGDWKEHGERTGGFYACNRCETVWEGVYDRVWSKGE